MAVNTLLKLPLTVSLADDLEVESRYFFSIARQAWRT